MRVKCKRKSWAKHFDVCTLVEASTEVTAEVGLNLAYCSFSADEKFTDITFGLAGLGFLRLHSTYRHDLKMYASEEGRVQMTAAAFTKVQYLTLMNSYCSLES